MNTFLFFFHECYNLNILYFIFILILTEATLYNPHTLLFKTNPKRVLKHHIFWIGWATIQELTTETPKLVIANLTDQCPLNVYSLETNTLIWRTYNKTSRASSNLQRTITNSKPLHLFNLSGFKEPVKNLECSMKGSYIIVNKNLYF